MKFTVKLETWKGAKGHRNLLSGGGKHRDKRQKRQRTRNAALRIALKS